jgi:uncharacterized membrane protein HdeD (DUF308 family)
MAGVQDILSGLNQVGCFLQNHLPWDQLPEPTILAAVAVLAGFILAFWGARLLKLIFILACTAGGAAGGVHLTRQYQVDNIFGLILGGAFAALFGYLLYRWWIGLLTGLCTLLIVAAIAAPRFVEDEVEKFKDYQLGVGGAAYTLEQPEINFESLTDYFWTQRKSFAIRTLFALGLSFVLGVLVGVLMPRFASVVATSLLGVTFLAGGLYTLVALQWPRAWRMVQAEPGWFAAVLVLITIVSLSIQGRKPRHPVVANPVPQQVTNS